MQVWQPIEVAPLANPFRDEPNLGDQTIAWQDLDFGPPVSDAQIVAYNRANGSTQVLTPATYGANLASTEATDRGPLCRWFPLM